ncbi:MAG: hypothetical protein M2R45_02857 [Verrucomicrobia subdivision 3 bacterium]|nr:hypothetical protein [Limisphaerales bacterium]MCS1415440.1 hypothetical protein [Limisphaerales bacterium]
MLAKSNSLVCGKYVRAVGPRLRVLLHVVFGLVAVLGVNSVYLASVTFLEWRRGEPYYQGYFYLFMFLGHLLLGLVLLGLFVIFGIGHVRNAYNRPNRRAVRAGFALLGASMVLLLSGVGLMQVEGFEIPNSNKRSILYWIHVMAPLPVVWLYVLHRLAGPGIKWRAGLGWAVAAGVVVLGMVVFHSQDPRRRNVERPREGAEYFEPSLARTASGNFIPADVLMMDEYCMECHSDAYDGWFHSAHHFSSFNNEPYLFSITETRRVLMERDGSVKASRWCAGCHDVVPFFSGAFDDPNFDMENHPTAHAGITCTACHAIIRVNSPRGNADYTIEEPIHYPFAKSENRWLRFINRQLVKAKPAFHKRTFLKPLHQTAEFCSTCHKVSLPRELTGYKDWHRGQNHYDNFLVSGVSGGNAKSFYYPLKAEVNCNGCHMPLQESNDFGADFFGQASVLSIHNHLFPGGNTGVPALRGDHASVAAQQEILKGALRVDIFGIREGGVIDGELFAPLGPQYPVLVAGESYWVEVVLRTLTVGHVFTQGTADSNEVWVEVKAVSGEGMILGRNGGLGEYNRVDPWSHFVNVYMLDREGNRIDRRNAQDIFTPLYDNQIPPGAASALHYRLEIPLDYEGSVELKVRLNYRKFDTAYMQHVYGPAFVNNLPITRIAEDSVRLPVAKELPEEGRRRIIGESDTVPDWQRWNDYGIGLLLKGGAGSEKGQLRQAEHAFAMVEKGGRADGPLNLARVYLKEGRVSEAVEALQRAASFDPPAPRWTLAWLNALVNKENGLFDEAIRGFRSILEDRYEEIIERRFDFSRDYQVLNELGLAYHAKSTTLRARPEQHKATLRLAVEAFQKTLVLDPENETAHHNLGIIHSLLGDEERAAEHRRLHERYRSDNNARDRVIAIARERDPAARNASQPVVVYDLHRAGAPGG